MVVSGDTSFRDGWGERQPDEVLPTRRSGRRGARWVLVGVGIAAALVGGYFAIKPAVIEWLSQACHEALQAEDWGRVETLAARWHALDSGRAAPLIYLAEAANRTQQFERAVAWLDALPDGDPMTPPALVEQSTFLFEELNRPIAGAECLERAVRLAPMQAEARRRLVYFYAYTLQRHKMVEQAYDTIRHGCDFPETYVYLMSRDWLSFANAYDENTKWFQGNPDEELFLVARAIYRVRTKVLDDSSEAHLDGPAEPDGTPYHRKILAEYLQRFPRNLELLAYYLDQATSHGKTDDVARLLGQAPPEAADDNRFWRYRGWLHVARGELTDAEQCYRKAISINRYDYLTRHQLAGVLRRVKRVEEVKELESLSHKAKELRSQIYQLPTIDKVPPPILRKMLDFARQCGDDLAASHLAKRIDAFSGVWSETQRKGK